MSPLGPGAAALRALRRLESSAARSRATGASGTNEVTVSGISPYGRGGRRSGSVGIGRGKWFCCECLPRGREFSKPCQACSALRAGVEAVSGADRRKSNRCSFGQRFVE